MKYSFIIPTKNNYTEFENLFKSIKSQSKRNYEIIVVDVSNDNKIEKFSRKNGITFIRQAENSGLSNARNIGWKHSKGEWIIWLDADHILGKNFIKNMSEFIKMNPFDCISPKQIFLAKTLLQKIIKAEWTTNMRTEENKLPTIVKRVVLQYIDGWDESLNFFGEDRDFNQKIRKKYEVGFSEKSKIFVSGVENIHGLCRQSISYGKSMKNFLMKNFNPILFFGVVTHSVIIPIFLISLLWQQFSIVSRIVLSILFLEAMYYAMISKNIFGIFVPLIKIFRSTIEIVYLAISK